MNAPVEMPMPLLFTDNAANKVKELIAEVRTRLNVAERLANTQCDIDSEIPVSAPQSENIVDQVSEYFSGEKSVPQVAGSPTVDAH